MLVVIYPTYNQGAPTVLAWPEQEDALPFLQKIFGLIAQSKQGYEAERLTIDVLVWDGKEYKKAWTTEA
jgi:hypothetical protein